MDADKKALIDGLNSDLAGEFQAIIQYTDYAARVTGPFRQELRAMFLAEVPDEQGHAQYLADQIAYFGGTPTTTPRPVASATTPKQMLQRILEAEERAVRDYTERAKQAEACGEIALKVALENQIADEETHRQQVARMLAGWPE
ncbi:MAG TPA: ferritin-like domain-containing protein [Isosphaeraceae bacterium]|jgi:bacterioferritin|nr:ferritin-like domain-containing protein [Isosphaeraceae bacterium]